ncbi:MAG: hypothetical protein N2560_02520 [Ignavibacteria bacterium]|nr:hypothetical protein [Ignavibacteria bacterium]
MKKLIILIIFINLSIASYSQKVVVSEYYNVSGDPLGEWTELLVVEDNVDLVGFTLRDNAGSTPPPSQWTGGIRFKNHPLWRNLRAGTIIVINHRYSAYQSVDVDKSDGYIEIDAENETYFEKRCFSCIVGPEWYQKALNLAQESEIVEILDQNDNHVHALAHMPSAGGDWLTMPDPKISYVGSITRGGVTVRVCPGLTLSAYNKGFDTREEEVTQSADLITKGKPNNRVNFLNQNQLFWRSLREPNWNSPSANAKVFKDSVILSWNVMVDPYPQDSVSGYLIVRIPYDNLGSAIHPIDGKRYKIGDNLGSGTIIGIVNYSQITRFVDKYSLQCGMRYVYRIYAFRFKFDDFNEDNDETNARGRSYNQRTFAQVEVEKTLPPKPEIYISKGSAKVCEGDTIVLKVQNRNRYSSVIFRWFIDGNSISGNFSDSLIVTTSGAYKVEVQDSLGCSVLSESVNINIVKFPQISLILNGKEVKRDTTIVLCPNESINCRLLGWFKFGFFKDDKLVEEAEKSEWTITSSGSYFFSASNDICTTKTPKITVKYLDLKLRYSPTVVKFFVDKNEVSKDTTIVVTNLSSDTVKIDKIVFEDGNSFELVSPKLPFVLLPKGQVNLVVRFKPLRSGNISGKMFLHKECNQIDTIFLEGTKAKTVLIFTKKEIDFGIIPDCFAFSMDSTLSLFNDSNEEIKITNVLLDNPFELITPKVPISLSINGKVDFVVKLPNFGIGSYVGFLKIYFSYSNIPDSLIIPIKGKVEKVQYVVNTNSIENIVFDECEVSKKFVVDFVNKSNFDLALNLKSQNNDIKIVNSTSKVGSLGNIQIEFVVNPSNLGVNKSKIYLEIEPCTILDSFEVRYTKKGIIVNFAQDTIDFGKLQGCFDIEEFQKSLSVRIVGDTFGLTKVKNIDIQSPFKCSLQKGTSLSDGSNIQFSFSPQKNGKYFAMVKLVLDPCGTEYHLFLKGELIRGKFLASKDTVDFGEVEIGTVGSKNVFIYNIGDTLINILSTIIRDETNFNINPKGNINLLLPQKDSSIINISFKPISEGIFETIAELRLGFPCDTLLMVVVKGKGKAPKPPIFSAFIEKHKFKPFTVGKVPVRFNFENSSVGSLDSMNVKILFYPRVFNVTSVYSGSFWINPEINHNDGIIKVGINPKQQNISEGVLFYLEGMVFLGDRKGSELKFDDFKIFSNRQPKVVLQDGSVEIDSVCVPDLRLISSETLPMFDFGLGENGFYVKIISNNVFYDTEFFIYDMLGRCILKDRFEKLEKGEIIVTYQVPLSKNQLYYGILRLGDLVQTYIINN